MTGGLSRESWIVPVHGLAPADPDGTVQATARRDGSVILHLSCGDSWATMRLDISRAAQLSTGIWEAAETAQQLVTGQLREDQPPPQSRPTRSEVRPVAGRLHRHHSTPP